MTAAVRGGFALLILAAVVIGLPVLLLKLGGDPLPSHVPAWHQVTGALLHKDNGTLFLGAVRDVAWIAWALFTVAVLAEAQAALRGRKAPRLRAACSRVRAGWSPWWRWPSAASPRPP
jgi:hypothetical protein